MFLPRFISVDIHPGLEINELVFPEFIVKQIAETSDVMSRQLRISMALIPLEIEYAGKSGCLDRYVREGEVEQESIV
jgi:hypothetical protein